MIIGIILIIVGIILITVGSDQETIDKRNQQRYEDLKREAERRNNESKIIFYHYTEDGKRITEGPFTINKNNPEQYTDYEDDEYNGDDDEGEEIYLNKDDAIDVDYDIVDDE